jgi:hypothetical protein
MRLDTSFSGDVEMCEFPVKFDEVILGWLLGVVSTPLVMFVTGFVQRRRFEGVLNEELREVRFRLVSSIWLLRNHMGKMDRTFLEWTVGELSAYPEGPEQNRLLEGTHRLLELADAQLAAFAARRKDPLRTKSFPRVVVPYLSSNLESVGLLCSSKQKELVNLLHYVEVINAKAEDLAEWTRRTFEVTNNENHTLASENADSSVEAIIAAAERSVACIKNYFF